MSAPPSPGPASRKPNLDNHPRILGVILLVIGLIFGFIAFYFPIHDALQGAAKVAVYSKAIFTFVSFTITGFTFIILGPIGVRLAYQGFSLRGWKKWLLVGLLLAFFIACGELVRHILEQYLAAFGYKF